MSDEYEEITDASPLAQGDVFAWAEEYVEGPRRRYGVVVTADCDLEHGKAGGTLSFVPALTGEDYLWHFWRARKLSSVHATALRTLAQRTTKVIQKTRPDQTLLSDSAMAFMVSQHGENLPLALGLSDTGQVSDYRRELNKFLALDTALSSTTPDIPALIRAYEHVSKKAGVANRDRIVSDFQQAIVSLPGDVFHITTTSKTEDGGLFLMLRHISQCGETDVAVRPEELRFGSAKARRIGRIAAPFRYAMTQSLGRVFSDIGLSSASELRRASSSENLFKGWNAD